MYNNYLMNKKLKGILTIIGGLCVHLVELKFKIDDWFQLRLG